MTFRPPHLMRNPHLQSVLSSMPMRRPLVERGAAALESGVRDLLLDCGSGVRLLAHHSEPDSPNGATVMLIHGWEGSASSLYVLTAARALLGSGFRVVRLNLRDHGYTHHLNEGIFHSCRLDEAIGAARAVQQQFPEDALCLAGFSLGGNFVLRIAARAPFEGLGIERVVAVCPVLDPAETMDALEYGKRLYHWYFIRKWRRSLAAKRLAFPHLYDFGDLARFRSLKDMTAHFVERFTEYPDLATYLGGYAITGDKLETLEARSVLLAAADDPVIPVGGLERVARPDALTVVTSPVGGHCAFLENWRLRSWADEFVATWLARA